MYDTRIQMIIPVAESGAANTALETAGFGPNTFSVGLSATGLVPFTHYGCSWIMTAREWTKVQSVLTGHPVDYYRSNEYKFPEAIQAKGVKLVRSSQ